MRPLNLLMEMHDRMSTVERQVVPRSGSENHGADERFFCYLLRKEILSRRTPAFGTVSATNSSMYAGLCVCVCVRECPRACVDVRARMRACMRARVCAHVRVFVCVRACPCVRVCMSECC